MKMSVWLVLKSQHIVSIGTVICLFLLPPSSLADVPSERVNVVLNDAGYPPFHMKPVGTGENVGKGIVVDMLHAFQLAYPKYDIHIFGIPKLREQKALDDGTADMTYNSPSFIGERAQNFLWSDSFAKSRDVVVMLKSHQFPFKEPVDLFGKDVGTIRGFGYREYESYFRSGKIIRHDVKEAVQLLKMLRANRIDCFFGNIYVIPYEIWLHQEKLDDFYFSDNPLYEFDLMFQINAKKPQLKYDLDSFIRAAKKSGLLQSFFDAYQ